MAAAGTTVAASVRVRTAVLVARTSHDDRVRRDDDAGPDNDRLEA
jgi:hypothetical protein